MTRLSLAICVLLSLACSQAFAQPQTGWTISYTQKSLDGTGNRGSITGPEGSSCFAAIYGSPNSSSSVTVVTTMSLTKAAGASATISFKAQSGISGSLSASGNSCTSTVSGAQFTTNTYTLSAQGNYNVTGYGPGNSRDQPATFEFTCEANISGNNYGTAHAEGKYNFLP